MRASTRQCIATWFRQLTDSDPVAAAWLLGRSITDDGGSYDYRPEEGLDYWVEQAADFSADWRRRLEMIVEAPVDTASIRSRLTRLEPLFATDQPAAEAELQLLAAAVHGDALRLPAEGYALLREFATAHGCALPAGTPDVSYPERNEDHFPREPEPPSTPVPWDEPASPQAMIHRLRSAMDDRQITNTHSGIIVSRGFGNGPPRIRPSSMKSSSSWPASTASESGPGCWPTWEPTWTRKDATIWPRAL